MSNICSGIQAPLASKNCFLVGAPGESIVSRSQKSPSIRLDFRGGVAASWRPTPGLKRFLNTIQNISLDF